MALTGHGPPLTSRPHGAYAAGPTPMPVQGRASAAAGAVLVLVALMSGSACKGAPPAPKGARQVVQWRSLGSWSGRGNAQTGSFPSVTGSMRVNWRADRQAPGPGGAFRLTIHSAVSGRPLLVAVDHPGAGHDTSYVHE